MYKNLVYVTTFAAVFRNLIVACFNKSFKNLLHNLRLKNAK